MQYGALYGALYGDYRWQDIIQYYPMATWVELSALHCIAVQCSAVQCSAVQCSAVQCSAVQDRPGISVV